MSHSSLLADLMSGEDPVPGHLLAVLSHGGERARVFASPLAGYQFHHGSPILITLSNSLPKTPPPDTITWGLGACKHSVRSTSSSPPFPPTFTKQLFLLGCRLRLCTLRRPGPCLPTAQIPAEPDGKPLLITRCSRAEPEVCVDCLRSIPEAWDELLSSPESREVTPGLS